MQDEAAFRRTAEGLSVRVRATPRGGRDAIDGVEYLADGRAVLRIRVRAAAAEGAANEALRRCLAASLGRPPSAVSIASGASARVKIVAVAGDPDDLAARLEALCARETSP